MPFVFQFLFPPQKPFPEFKWKWASLQCTEGINDPVVLLGALFRMRKIEGSRFSSEEFATEMKALSVDLANASIGVNLAGRTGDRNIMRNSKQYWTATKLLEPTQGIIKLTDFGRQVADRKISQAEFAAITIQTLKLPNPTIQSNAECALWDKAGLQIFPLKLILKICLALHKEGQGYITTDELIKIIIPLSGAKTPIEDYVKYLVAYRNGELSLSDWPDCVPEANDKRIAREFLLFLSNYGYLQCVPHKTREDEQYFINEGIIDEITFIACQKEKTDISDFIQVIRSSDVVSDIERFRVRSSVNRPNQANFRRALLDKYEGCIITNVTMPEVLEAAHIKPFKYKGEDTVANGFLMRTDIHLLFDSGNLRISEEGFVELSDRARYDYGAAIPRHIVIPDFVNKDFIRWRWYNYNGI